MGRLPGFAAFAAHRRRVAAAILCGALLPATPALAQTAAPPGSTINGTVPTTEGNVWNGFDHQPTPADAGPSGNAQQQAKINRKLNKLDQQLLNDPLPKLPKGAPPVAGSGS